MRTEPISSSQSTTNFSIKLPPSTRTRSTIESLEASSAKPSTTKIFFEDLLGFFCNMTLWPIHGYHLLTQHVLFIVFLPILLPFIIITEFVALIIKICTCSCCDDSFLGPKFSPVEPTTNEKEALQRFVDPHATSKLPQEDQIRLLHLLNTYLQFSNKYHDDPFGKNNTFHNCLIKVSIDGLTHLFQYQVYDDRKVIFKKYLKFITKYATNTCKIKHTFVGLDYSYFFGMFKMKVKTDVVKYSVGETIEYSSSCFPFFSYFFPQMAKHFFSLNLGKHKKRDDLHEMHFAMWPGSTREICCNLINRSLRGHDLDDAQISLLDLGNLVRLKPRLKSKIR